MRFNNDEPRRPFGDRRTRSGVPLSSAGTSGGITALFPGERVSIAEIMNRTGKSLSELEPVFKAVQGTTWAGGQTVYPIATVTAILTREGWIK